MEAEISSVTVISESIVKGKCCKCVNWVIRCGDIIPENTTLVLMIDILETKQMFCFEDFYPQILYTEERI